MTEGALINDVTQLRGRRVDTFMTLCKKPNMDSTVTEGGKGHEYERFLVLQGCGGLF